MAVDKSSQDNFQSSWVTAQAVIVGLVITEALLKLYNNVDPIISTQSSIHDHLKHFEFSVFLSFLVFFVLLVRFYLGALRFSQIPEGSLPQNAFGKIVDGIGASVLFTFFFFMASSLDDPSSFIKYIFFLHIADVCWFILKILSVKDDKNRRRISITFLILSIVTVLFFIICKDTSYRMIFLILISILDFIILLRFYTNKETKLIWQLKE